MDPGEKNVLCWRDQDWRRLKKEENIGERHISLTLLGLRNMSRGEDSWKLVLVLHKNEGREMNPVAVAGHDTDNSRSRQSKLN